MDLEIQLTAEVMFYLQMLKWILYYLRWILLQQFPEENLYASVHRTALSPCGQRGLGWSFRESATSSKYREA